MKPVYVSGCFGVLHPANGHHGVLICGTLSDEAMNAYRPLAFLAERFAAAGCPTLRLDYYGNGDSAGEDGEPDRFQAWLNGVADGVRWLRENCGVGPVTLVGVRVGAAIAARAACDIDDVAALICLAPLASGRRFLREMILAARTTADIWQVEPNIDDGTWFEAHGMRLDHPTRDALDRLDTASLPHCPAPAALVLDRPESPAGRAMAERLGKLGADVTFETADGLEGMLRDPYENTVPHNAFERTVAWHGDTVVVAREPVPPARTDPGPALLQTSFGTETPVRFGPGNTLFGILSDPAHGRPGVPPMLIANTGANPRYGNSRSATSIARWLAANGIASLRMDGAGIGDSAIETGERGVPYSAQGDQDLAAGIDELTRHHPGPVLLLGMCSGAFHALRAAYTDPRISALALVNLQKFVWQGHESLSVVQRTTFRTTHFYLRNVTSAAVWRRMLRGEINVSGISHALAGRVMRRAAALTDPVTANLRRQETAVGQVRRQMRHLQQRGVQILFLLSGNDPGLDEIAEYFGSQGRQLRRMPNVMFGMLHGADHTLSAWHARDMLIRQISAFLQQRCGIAISGSADVSLAEPRPAMARLDAALLEPLHAVTPAVARTIAIDTGGSAA